MDVSNFGLGGVLSQIQDDVECVVAYCIHALRPSQRRYCTTKREMLAAVSICLDNVLFVSKENLRPGLHHPLGNIPPGHRWDRMAMDILDMCDPTPDGYQCILLIADYFSKWDGGLPNQE